MGAIKLLLIAAAAVGVISMFAAGQGGDFAKAIGRGVGFGIGREAAHAAFHHH